LQVSNNITAHELQAVLKDKNENLREVVGTNNESIGSYYSQSKTKKKKQRNYWDQNSQKETGDMNSFQVFQFNFNSI